MTTPAEKLQDTGAIAEWFESQPINQRTYQYLAEDIYSRLPFFSVAWTKDASGTPTHNATKMLDYACGSGILTRIFAPHVSSITAIDISASQIERYKTNIPTFEIPPENISTLIGDLLADVPQPLFASEAYHDFDFITVGAALHHFPSAEMAVRALGARLSEGGVLAIQDLWDGGQHDDGETRKGPRGFTEESMRGMMEGVGLTDFRMVVLPRVYELALPSGEVASMQCFIARAEKHRTKQ
ncbi:S-adenosyl-L-methionine-dependent methyltransferase [Lentithecium fluviatile CBS 122367]|uniref:S-adenosyl-L-methionine-dependent methyltransferase n=1 Tax=Lentithecium fluviatile CBS 122367 TaxID=1168545 RepID=A0A6G1J1M8_9PLEO|nr:S-adenosyl-L-methionine-dependent methyltransferase [Lentithecium fluviatile CBS 122367]